ncbi:hypothetical protein [Petrotoga halophila]|uniref:Uncharacterized protein n=2 Tax=Petrotoga TaxID=28236 RepID=A0A2S5E8P9_9BACT|nr:hypothetical protein [Petrotoga halophila]POZ89524.1 hypothetical protein AA81_13730 [Petrotoga halophila DSM 16923]
MKEKEKEVLDYCIKDIEYRIKSCESSYEKGDFNEKVSDFRAFIFSLGSSMDIMRNEIFEDYNQSKKRKYFSDIFDIKSDKKQDIRSCRIRDDFRNYLSNNYTDQNKKQKILEIMENLGIIISNDKYYFTAQNFSKGKIEKKKISLWDIYNSLKHSCYPRKPNTYAYFKDELVGYKGEMLLSISTTEGEYSFEIFGGWVPFEGAEEDAKNKENPYLKMIKDIGNYIIRNLKALEEVI